MCGTSHIALGRVGPVPHLGKTGELALVMWMVLSQPQELESRKTIPLPWYMLHWARLLPGQGWRASPVGEEEGKLVDWPILLQCKTSSRAVGWPTPTSTKTMNFWTLWKSLAGTWKDVGSPWHKITTGYTRRVEVSVQYP